MPLVTRPMTAPTERRGPKIDLNQYQTHWHPEEICEDIPDTPDTFFTRVGNRD